MLIEQKQHSSQGLLSMLEEKDKDLKIYALKKIDRIVNNSWHEIADKIALIESYMEDPDFPEKDLAASIVSKVFYFLEEYESALRLALQSGGRFDLNEKSLYVEKMTHKCIDTYMELRQRIYDKKEENLEVDPRMEEVIQKVFNNCMQLRHYKYVIGVAIESRRLDWLKQCIETSDDVEDLLSHTYNIAMSIVKSKFFRQEILRLLLSIYQLRSGDSQSFDYFKICKCQFFLNMPESTALLLSKLLQENQMLVAYQIAFDILDNENQQFQQALIQKLSEIEGVRVDKLNQILKGEIRDRLTLQFLKKNNHTDMLLLSRIKEKISQKNSVIHGSAIIANGLMNAYTQNDTFLKDNLSWATLATNWSRFNATGTLGVIHMGNTKEAIQILQPYFHGGVGEANQNSSPYSTAGAYFAFGLINANQSSDQAKDFLLEGFRNSGQNEAIQHGICLGLGLVGMGSGDEDLYEELKNTLFSNADSAVIGEAAAYGIGLIKLGQFQDNVIEELFQHAQDQNHEKIIRAISIALAMVMFGREELADPLIEQMTRSQDPILRYGAMFGIGLAYCGTSNTEAVKRLLHFSVSDVADDVKRAALMNLGFVMFRQYSKIPDLVKQLAESYNPHLRYGACYALGIGCCGTGSVEAIKILAPLTNDSVDFVRQGALISLALIFIQVTEKQEPKVLTIKKLYQKMTEDKHEEILSKQGAIISQGIINGAGRNATISLITRDGSLRQTAVAGLTMFLQHWYWYPCFNMLSLSFTPTILMGLNEDLKVPKSFKFISQAKGSMYKYPEFMKKDDNRQNEKMQTAVLSTTAKVRARVGRKKQGEDVQMGVEEKKEEKKEEEKKEEEKKEEEKKEEKEEEKKEEEEPDFQEMNNPSRVLKQQEKVIKYKDDCRYRPILPNRYNGFIVLQVNNSVQSENEIFYDDEERDLNAPNPDMHCDMKLPEEFEFDPNVQNAN